MTSRIAHIAAVAVLLAALAAATLASLSSTADAHRSGCHRWHSCPSDHATYRWRGMLCVAPDASERTSAFKVKVTYQGRTYYCKR